MKIKSRECKYCKGNLLLKQFTSNDLFWQCLQCGRIIYSEKVNNELAGV